MTDSSLQAKEEEPLSVRDMYADLEKIEARGKRKKEKKSGLFSFGRKDDVAQAEAKPEPQPSESAQPKPTAAPPQEPEPTPGYIQPPPDSEPQHPVAQEQKAHAVQPKPEPVVQASQPLPKSDPVQEPAVHKPAPPVQENRSGWKPLTGGRLEKANAELHEYKKWLNKGYKSGVLTKEQCTGMVRAKEVELGLRPPEQ